MNRPLTREEKPSVVGDAMHPTTLSKWVQNLGQRGHVPPLGQPLPPCCELGGGALSLKRCAGRLYGIDPLFEAKMYRIGPTCTFPG